MIETSGTKRRADLFRYVGLAVTERTLRATFELDGRTFVESVEFEGVGDLTAPAATAVAQLWFLVAGLSYYKAGAARRVDLGEIPVGRAGRALLAAALRDGLGEFSYVNDLPLDDVEIVGGADVVRVDIALDPERVLIPFGGGHRLGRDVLSAGGPPRAGAIRRQSEQRALRAPRGDGDGDRPSDRAREARPRRPNSSRATRRTSTVTCPSRRWSPCSRRPPLPPRVEVGSS